MEKPNYYSIIPADVRYDNELSSTAKLLYAEITSLSNKDGYCWASNRYFAELYNLSETQISLIIKQLQDRGYVTIEIEKEKGNKRKIWLTPLKENLKTSLRKLKDPSLRKLKDPPAEKMEETRINKGENEIEDTPNNTSINNHLSKDKGVDTPFSFNLIPVSRKSNKEVLAIIYLFAKEMGYKFENKKAEQSFIKRNLRPAKLLVGYSFEDIQDTLKELRKIDYLKKITLGTITKYIDDIIVQKKKFNKRKIIRWEEVRYPDGTIKMKPIFEKKEEEKLSTLGT